MTHAEPDSTGHWWTDNRLCGRAADQVVVGYGKVWAYGGRYVSPHLVNYDLEPVYYDMRVWTYIIGVVVGLCMVWVAMGGKLPWIKQDFGNHVW